MTFRLERMADVPLSRVVDAWNDCFSDYYVPIAMDMTAFVAAKLASEDVHPERSFVVFAEGREAPVGFLLNAFRDVDGERFAWNGGTAVHPDYRGKGVGALLLAKAQETYREHGVDTALLEAFVQNEGAVRLYRRFGYETFDMLHGMAAEGAVDFGETEPRESAAFRVELRPASALDELRFAPSLTPWQTMRQSAKTGEALVAYGAAGRPVGCALRRRTPAATTLLQCAVDPALPEAEASAATRLLLRAVFAPGSEAAGAGAPVRRSVFAAPASQPALRAALAAAGFEDKYALVHMRLRF